MLKNITLSADARLIEKARKKARDQHTTLNSEFRKWLEKYSLDNTGAGNYVALMKYLSYSEAGLKFSRDELNER
jgi:hypothetical protein